MAGRPWYAFYPDAYERDAGSLSYVEDSAYRRMLDLYYKTNEPLSLNHDEIFRACKAMKRDERAAILKCLGLFFVAGDDGYHQLRCDAEIIKAAELSQKRANAANKRHAKAHAIAGPIAEQLDTHSTSTATEVETSKKKVVSAAGAAPPKTQKGTRWPSEAVIEDSWILFAEETRQSHGLAPIDLRLEAAKFTNYWASKSGGGATKTDWKKTWINWALNGKGKINGSGNNQKPAAITGHLDGIASIVSDIRNGRTASG